MSTFLLPCMYLYQAADCRRNRSWIQRFHEQEFMCICGNLLLNHGNEMTRLQMLRIYSRYCSTLSSGVYVARRWRRIHGQLAWWLNICNRQLLLNICISSTHSEKKNTSVAVPNYPILIQPYCDSDGLCRLSISLTLDLPAKKAHEVVCEFAPDVQGVPTHNYTKDNLSAADDAGSLNVPCAPRDGAVSLSHAWAVEGDTVGPVTLQLEILPKFVDTNTPVTPQVDLRRDRGGLLGSGGWFLPSIPGQERFLFSVEWDLTRAAAGTRACWSYGEGPDRTEQEGPLPFLLNSPFMVDSVLVWRPARLP